MSSQARRPLLDSEHILLLKGMVLLAVVGFAFVGADGVHSRTRTLSLQGPAATYTGTVAWRITLPHAALQGVIAPDRTSLLLGPGYHAVCYPLPHRKQVDVVLFSRVPEAGAEGPQPPKSPRLPWAMLRSHRFDAILAAAPAVEDGRLRLLPPAVDPEVATAVELVSAYRTGELSPVEATTAAYE